MKKAKTIGKKTLSVFLAVLMVLTAWVWVAPTEASAVDAGKYYVRVSYDCSDAYDGGSAYTGPSFTDIGAGYTIYYSSNNGTGPATYSSSTVVNLTTECKSSFTTKTKVTECQGFPTSVYYYNKGGTIFSRTYGITKVEVGSTSSGPWTTLWEGDIEADAASTQWKAHIDKDGVHKDNTGTGSWTNAYDTTKNWNYPKANEVIWDATPSNFTIPSSTYGRTHCEDQYNVVLGVNPTNSFTSTPTTGLSGSTSNGTTYSQYTITANDSAKMSVQGVNSRSVTMTASYTFGGATVSSSKSFTIFDPKYTITFNKNANDASNMAPASYSVYYGESLASQAAIDKASTYPTGGNRTGYIFLGMYDATTGGNLMNVNEVVTAAKTYYAHWEILKYAAVFLDRSGDEVILVESDIPHGSAATKADEAAAKLNKVEFDDVNHYVLNESDVWTTSTDSSTDSVKENTFFYPNYVASAHTLDAGTVIEATCQHGAGIEYKCTGCDYSYIEETSTTLGSHVKSDSYIVDTEATCEAAGSGHYYCTVCGATVETVTIPAKGHSYKVEVTKAATCKEVGNRKYTCLVCDDFYNEEIPLTQHNYVAGDTVSATCQHSPYTAYTCSGCGDTYNKYEGNATTNHNWNITVSDVTANNTKIVTGTCSVCNATFTKEVELPATHNFTNVSITKQPTCKVEGEITISCADNGCTESYTATLPTVSTAHTEYETTYTPAACSAKGSVVTKCKECGAEIKTTEIEALKHSYDYVRVEPTCTANGSITKTCANCGDVQTEPISATGHKTVTVEANCQHDGYVKCAVCGETLSETSKKAHNYAGEVKEVSATCTVDGIRFTKCTECDAQIADILTKTGHDSNVEWVEIIPATCLGKGLKTKTCSKCNVILESEEIPALNHSYVKDEEESYAATCTSAGAEAEKCSRCGDINITVIQPLGHDWDAGVRTDATCTSGGYITYTCQRTGCGETKIELINGSTALPHDFTGEETIVKDATCESDGHKTVKCANCNATTTVIIQKLGHTWGEWEVTKEATNNEDGEMQRTCSNNTCTETVKIPKGGHEWDNGTVTETANCTKAGKMVYKCTKHTDCGITIEVTVPMTQHTVDQRVTEATCTTQGKVEAYCTVCNTVFKTTETPVKAHSFDVGTPVAATCTTSGYTLYQCTADGCDFSYKEYDETKPATGHDFDETITENVTTEAATCTADGSKTIKCKNCSETKTETISKLGHNYIEDTSAATSATCKDPATKTYKCNNAGCGDTYTEYVAAANGHKWNEKWVVVREATDDKNGVEKTTCTVCGEEMFRTTEPIGDHSFTEEITTQATCTTDGLKTFTCSEHTNCSANYTETIPATGHTQKIEYTAPTCIAEGSSKIVCGVCGHEIASESIPTIYHDFSGEGVKVDATCTVEGTITYTCTTANCGETKTEKIPTKGHTLTTTVNHPTCGEKGSVVTECTVCSDPTVKKVTELAAKGHIWGTTPTKTEAATCETDGSETYKCQNCDETKEVVIPALGHTWGEWTVTPSTNNDKGSVSRECLRDDCTATESVDIPAGGHNLVVDTANSTDASCTTEGETVYKCDAHTGENDCGISVTVTVPAKGHKVVVKTTEAKCEEAGSVVEKCETCGVIIKETPIPAKGHTITVTTTPATCTSEGSVVEDCDDCDYTKTTKIVKLQHDFSGEENETTPATCEVDGEKTVKCKNCEETTTVITPKLGHKWSAWVKVDATNDTNGSWTRTCENNPEHKEVVEIPAGGHNLVEDVDQYVAPKCNEKGKKVYVCNNAAHTDCSVTVTVELDYAQHTVVQKINEASCTKTGSVEAYCSVCDKVFSTKEIPVKAHEYTAGTPVDATCTTSGYTPYTCSCGDTYNKYDNSKPATGHTLVEGASTATCENEGIITLRCENCLYTRDVKVPALGHNYVENTEKATAATCAAAATKTYECSCGESYTISVGDKLTGESAHNFGAWIVKESATASSLGYETRTCNDCGKVEVRTIPATGEHNFSTEISRQEATCTENGWIEYACSTHTGDDACEKTSKVEIPATGHDKKIEYKAATCTDAGYTKIVCAVDGCTYEAEKTVIPALGHDWNDGNVTNATCNTEGKIVRTCQRSGCTATHTTIIDTNPNAHQYETIVTDSTCTTVGSVITRCKLCGAEIPVKTLPVLEHSWNGGEIKDGDEATCEKDGTKTYTCTADNCTATKTETIAKLGHAWGEWTVTKASTNTEKGTLTRKCSRGCTEEANIPEGGHKLVETSRDDASCTKEGLVTYTCDAHIGENDCGISVTVTLAKTQHELEMKTEKQATCDVAGSVVTKCNNCDTVTLTTTIPATGHAWNEGVVTEAASCTKEGTMTYTCAHNAEHKYTAKIAMVQHKYIAETPVAPTCTSSGYTPYKCENCESSYVLLGDAAKSHTFLKDTSTADCENSGTMTLECACGVTMTTDVPALGHDYQLQSRTDATCAAAATETYKCSRCEANYTVSVGGKLTNDDAHDWNDWVVVEKADYDSIGYQTKTCKICGKLEVKTIDATGSHKLEEEKRDEPTCTTDGKIYYACSTHTFCGVTDEVVIPKLGHDEELSYKAASCTEEGYAKIVCSRCGELESKPLDKLEHSFEVAKIENSTCSAKGEISLKCKNCTETKTVEIPENSDAHSLTKVTDPATCKKDGSVVISCTLCGDELYKEPLPKLQHSWGDWSVKTPSTNDAEGEMVRHCDNGCEETVIIPAGGHTFGNTPDSIEEAKCTAEGSATYKCTAHANCGVEITVVLDKVQHTIVTDSETATCENGGYVKVYCSVCNEVYTDMTIGKLAHKDKIVETKAATCTTAGYTTFECENCGRGFSRLDAQLTGHKYINEGAVVVTNATCTTAGYTTYNCDNCDETHTVNIVPAKGHDWTEWTVENEATNTETGTLTRTCKNGCGETEKAEIPAGGHKFDVNNPTNTTTGDCQTKGTKTFKCTEHASCGIEITVETEFGAHDWLDWTKVDATNDKEGSWTRKCNTCGTDETLVIPAGGHNLVEDEAQYIAPKCDAKGQRVYKCDAHPGCSVTITVVLEKIQHTPDVEKKDATCTEDGFVKTYCTACGEVISNVVLSATGHINTRTERKESTCIEHGYEKVICVCSYIVSEKELPLIAHNYDANGDGKVDKKDAVFADGKYTYTCQQAGCGHILVEDSNETYKVRFFDAEGNQIGETQVVKYGESATAPTAPTKAADTNYHYEFIAWDRNFSAITSDLDVYPTYEKEAHFGGEANCKDKALCDICKTPYGELDGTKHIMTSVSTPATCEKDGVITYTCVYACGYGYSEKIEKLQHNYGAWTVIQQGTCETPHIQSRKCLNYGCNATEEKTTYSAHSWILEPAIAPTCTTIGYTEFKYCTVCNLQLDRKEVAKLSHNDRDGNGYCDYCGTSQGVPKCNCMCHSTGIMKLFYGIVRIFWIITRSSPSCSCGARHY